MAAWHGGPWTVEDAHRDAAGMAGQWSTDGVGKWIAHDLGTGELVGRGGLSRLGAAETVTRRIAAALPGTGWLRDRLEVGWTVRSALWGQGCATEIGRAGLADDAPFALYLVAAEAGWLAPGSVTGAARASPP